MSKFDALVVGAGLWGCIIARELAEAGKRVLVLESRDLPGGNARSAIDKATGIEYHCYGAHIFHTSNEKVWQYINKYAKFNDYRHTVLTTYQGKVYFMPLGLALINAFYGLDLRPDQVDEFIQQEVAKTPISNPPANLEEQAISLIGEPLYKAFIKGYTQKQWNADPKTLPAFIINRLPVRKNYNVSYFNDKYQGLPVDGYFSIFEKLLAHENIEVNYNTDYLAIRNQFASDLPTFYSGPIDAFFNYEYGALPWRGLKFEWETKETQDWQGTSVMNYADSDVPYTRIHEFKHFHPEREEVFSSKKTMLCREYPADWKLGDEPYYPVNTAESKALLEKYQALAKQYPNVIFGGRLGEYKYYDMDKVIDRALQQVEEFLN